MKMDNKFGGKFYLKLIAGMVCTICAILTGCLQHPSSDQSSKSVLPQLLATKNFDDLTASFTITKDTLINIKAFGEGVDYSINKEVIRSYDNDCVEVYFDMKNEKTASFDATGDDRQYRIVSELLRIDGINYNAKDVKIAQSDPDKQSYIMEMAFPWKTLGYITPSPNKKIGFDVAIDDNDTETRKGMLAWNSSVDDAWKSTAIYGTLLLSKTMANTPAHNAVSIMTTTAPAIDGKIESIWDKLPKYYFTNVMTGYVENKDDLSGYYRTMWDKDNFYLLVNVHDNIKRYAQAMFDYGWIENEKGNVIWTMEMDKTKHAGGAMKNRMCDTSILIKKGEYKLRYVTDESHSPKSWDAAETKSPFYGIKLSYNNRN
jgi:hypothetical protein